VALTAAQRLELAENVLDARLTGGAIDRYTVNGQTEIVRMPLKDLQELVERLRVEAKAEAAQRQGRSGSSVVVFKGLR
jgi:hypothetical protein